MGQWEMICKFNKILGLFFLWQRLNVVSLRVHLAARGITILEQARYVPKNANPTGRESVIESWLDGTGLQLAQVHYYELNGEFGGTGRRLPEPMILRHKGLYYEREKAPLRREGPFRYDGQLYWMTKTTRWLRCLLFNR